MKLIILDLLYKRLKFSIGISVPCMRLHFSNVVIEFPHSGRTSHGFEVREGLQSSIELRSSWGHWASIFKVHKFLIAVEIRLECASDRVTCKNSR